MPVLLGVAYGLDMTLRNTAPVLLEPDVAFALDLELETFGDGVDGADADAVKTSRDLVARVIEFAAGVQHGHHDLGRADALGVHDADRDTAPVVFDRDRAVEMDGDVDFGAMPGQVLVDAVVDGFPDQVMETGAVVDVTDVHSGALADGFEPLENGDVLCAVRRLGGLRLGRRRSGFSHSGVSVQPSLDSRADMDNVVAARRKLYEASS